MIDVTRWLGIPEQDLGRTRAGCDCWGLFRLVYAEALGIALPSYAGDYQCAREVAEVDRVSRRVFSTAPWVPVKGDRQDYDLLLFQRGPLAFHVGLAVGAAHMLHMSPVDGAIVAPVRAHWQRCLAGSFRHEGVS